MKVLIFGASGMVGQGVLRECLRADDVEAVTVVGRAPLEQQHAKLSQIVRADVTDLLGVEAQLRDFDACFFCLGVSSVGMQEAQYTQLTYDLTLSIAGRLARLDPGMTFIYVSGTHTDSTELGKTMWARVKGRTENALLRLPFKAAYMFRPGIIQPLHGVRSKTPVYQTVYVITKPLLSLARRVWPNVVLTTEVIGLAMLEATRHGAPTRILEPADINALAARAAN